MGIFKMKKRKREKKRENFLPVNLNLVEKNTVLKFSYVVRDSRRNIYRLVSRELKNTLEKLSRLEVSLKDVL